MKHTVRVPTKNGMKVAKKAGHVKKALMIVAFTQADLDHQQETIQTLSAGHKCDRVARMLEMFQEEPRTQEEVMAEWNIHNPRTHKFHYPWSAIKNNVYIEQEEETGKWWLTSKFYHAVDPNP